MSAGLPQRIAAEFLGTALLLAAVVGSGIMGARLGAGNEALALLANTLGTVAMLYVLILALEERSAHFNPLVTLGEAWSRALRWREVPGYLAAQFGGAFLGVLVAHRMFSEPLGLATKARAGGAQALSEFVATFGLVLVLRGVAHARPRAVAGAVAAYIGSAYWFTASTSFANPAVTLARSATDTFSGIRLADTPAFLLAQLGGAVGAMGLSTWLWPARSVVPAPNPRPSGSEPSARTVLFACVHNAGRSQMAAAFFNALADPRKARALSAGTRPAARVHPTVVEVMREAGYELGHTTPRALDSSLTSAASLLITLGCGEGCPLVPGLERSDWPLADPSGESPARVREIRDQIQARVVALVQERSWGREVPASVR